MKIKTDPASIWLELEKGQQYNAGIGLYDTVKKNENFFLGRQWEGLNAPDLEKPVLNFLRRVVTYFIAMIVSDDVAASFRQFRPTEGGNTITSLMAQEVERVIERTKLKAKNRLIIRNAAVDGDSYAYFRFDVDAQRGVLGQGEICVDVIDNTRILFGDPYRTEVQEQPYLLIVRRELLETVRDRAKAHGQDPEAIRPDSEERYAGEDETLQDLVTTCIKLYRQGETVWYTEVTRDGVVRPPTNLEYRLYPVAAMSWEHVKHSYHGQAAITGLIPNQIFVNKLWAMAMVHVQNTAFPKLFYDATKIREWTNRAGEAVGVMGDPRTAAPVSTRGGDMSSQVMELVDKTITLTRDFMGASDAALGNVKPDNTSAIIAVQKASSAPLELQRMGFYQFFEDCVRVMLDIIRTDYGLREVSYTDDEGQTVLKPFDFSKVDYDAMEVNVDVGAASYWSELMQIQTLDNLFAKGIITDAVTYLESIPSQYIPNKNKIIAKLKEQMASKPEIGSSAEIGGVASGNLSQMRQQPVYQ